MNGDAFLVGLIWRYWYGYYRILMEIWMACNLDVGVVFRCFNRWWVNSSVISSFLFKSGMDLLPRSRWFLVVKHWIWRMTVESHLVGGWKTPLKSMTSSVGIMASPTEWKIKMFQTTNQSDFCVWSLQLDLNDDSWGFMNSEEQFFPMLFYHLYDDVCGEQCMCSFSRKVEGIPPKVMWRGFPGMEVHQKWEVDVGFPINVPPNR